MKKSINYDNQFLHKNVINDVLEKNDINERRVFISTSKSLFEDTAKANHKFCVINFQNSKQSNKPEIDVSINIVNKINTEGKTILALKDIFNVKDEVENGYDFYIIINSDPGDAEKTILGHLLRLLDFERYTLIFDDVDGRYLEDLIHNHIYQTFELDNIITLYEMDVKDNNYLQYNPKFIDVVEEYFFDVESLKAYKSLIAEKMKNERFLSKLSVKRFYRGESLHRVRNNISKMKLLKKDNETFKDYSYIKFISFDDNFTSEIPKSDKPTVETEIKKPMVPQKRCTRCFALLKEGQTTCEFCGQDNSIASFKIDELTDELEDLLAKKHVEEKDDKLEKDNFIVCEEDIGTVEKELNSVFKTIPDIGPKITPSIIKKHLDEYVVGQDEAKRDLAVAVYNHHLRLKNPGLGLKRDNVFIVGGSGTGKTEMCRRLADFLDIPFFILDASNITSTGFKGTNIEEAFASLISSSSINNVKKSIIMLDELDKLTYIGGSERCADVGKNIQSNLLKIVEGTELEIKGVGKIDTSNILFIAAGAFSNLQDQVTTSTRKIGIGSDFEEIDKTKYKHYTNDDIIKAGIMPEFLGRFPIITYTNLLSVDDLFNIIKSKHGVLENYKAQLYLDQIELVVTDEDIKKIAKEAYETKLGARSLNGILMKYLKPILFDAPDLKVSGEIIKVNMSDYLNTDKADDDNNVKKQIVSDAKRAAIREKAMAKIEQDR